MNVTEMPAHGGNRERANAEITTGQASISIYQNTTVSRRPQGVISRFLLYGQHNAIPLQDILRMTKLDNRTARRMIEAERREGMPICSDNHTGYYLAETEGELSAFIRSMQHRAAEIRATAEALDRTLRQISGQERMEGF